MTKTAVAPPPPKAKDVRYTEKSDILKRVRAATAKSLELDVPITLANEVMTVEKAEDLLSLNEKNRNKSIEKTSDHSYTMKGNKKWFNFGDNLHISRTEGDRDIRLLNGQHRLNAYLAAAAEIEERNKQLRKEGKREIVVMWNIVCGVEPAAMSVIDTQKRRTATDWATIEGYSNPSTLTTAVRLVKLLEKGKVAGRVSGAVVGTDDVQEFLSSARRKKKIEGYVDTAVKEYKKEAKFLLPAQWAALHYNLSERTSGSKEADQFIEKLVSNADISPTSAKTSSIYHVRKLLEAIMPEPKPQRKKGEIKAKANPQDLTFRKFYLIHKAWNLYVRGMRVEKSDVQLTKEDKESGVLPVLAKV